jgi:hypothetical protein
VTQGLPNTTTTQLQVPDLQRRTRLSRMLWLGVLVALAAVPLIMLLRRE